MKDAMNYITYHSAGYSVESLINERGTDEMKKVMEEIRYE